ncbi:MAG: hypothetical protein ABEJ95_01575 [Candidatus Nanohalobium sp.]
MVKNCKDVNKNLTNSEEVQGARNKAAPIHKEFYRRDDTFDKINIDGGPISIDLKQHFVDINTTPQGLGKTHWMKEFVNETDKDVAITSREHDHLENEFKEDIDGATHRMGLIKLLREKGFPDDVISKAQSMYDAGVRPAIISKTLLDYEDNVYKKQLEEEPPYLDPLQFNHLQQYKSLDTLLIDEGIDGEEREFTFDKDLESIEEMIKVLKKCVSNISDSGEYVERLDELLEVFEYAFNQYNKKKLFNRFNGSLNKLFKAEEKGEVNFHINKDRDEDRASNKDDYYISHINRLYDFEDDMFQKHFKKLYYMFIDSRDHGKLANILYDVINENMSDGEIQDSEAVESAVEVIRLSRTLWESKDMNVVISEKWAYNGEWHCEEGKKIGSQKRVLFWMSKPHAFRIFDLSLKHNVDVKWAWAGFNEEWFNTVGRRYLDYKMRKDEAEYKIMPERYHPGGKQSFDKKSYYDINNLEEHIVPRITDASEHVESAGLKADIYKVTRPGNGTFSRSSLSTDITGERHFSESFKARMKQIAKMFDNTGFVGYMDFLEGEYDVDSIVQPTIFGDLPFKYWDGGGIQGTNDFEDFERIFLVGTPNKNHLSYIKRYYLMTGDFPALVNDDVREDTKYNNSSRMDAEYKKNDQGEREYYYSDEDKNIKVVHDMLVNSAVTDAALRLRNMRQQRKHIFVAGIVPEDLLDSLGLDRDDVENVSINEMVQEALRENEVLDEYSGKSVKQITSYTGVPGNDIKGAARESEDHTYNSGKISMKTTRSDEDIKEDILDLLDESGKTTTEIKKSVLGDEKRVREQLENLEDGGEVSSRKESGFSRKIEWFLK